MSTLQHQSFDGEGRFDVRAWNGTPISRRTTDGYVNATAMAKANGKQWNDYWRTDRATTYLEALSAETGIPVSKLCLSLKGGSHQGTWIHPQVAVDLARWISAPFAVWMDGWFLERLSEASIAPALPQATQAAEMMLVLEGMPSALQRAFPSVDPNLLGNAVVEGAARQWPQFRPMLEPVKLALAPVLREPQVTVTELANEYAQQGIGPSLRDIVEGSVWSIKRKTPASMMNELLCRAGLQVRVDNDSTKKYEPTPLGREYAVAILTTSSAANHQVQQIRWKLDSTLDFIHGWVENNHRTA